jgi:hypothetical protein
MIRLINNLILSQASKLKYIVKPLAPSTYADLKLQGTSQVIWSGGSEATIFGDATVNYAFRAIHDALHLATGLGFTVEQEIELARIHAARCSNSLLADLVWIEVAEQAKALAATGSFIDNQLSFTLTKLRQLGYKLA